jgi:pilus assembly protein CpaE
MQMGLIAATPARRDALLAWIGPLEGIELTTKVREHDPDSLRDMPVESMDILILDSPLDTSTQERDHDLAWLGQCVTRHPLLGVLWLTHDIDPAFLLQAMRSGVREVLPLHPDAAEFTQALNRLRRHAQSLSPVSRSDQADPGTPGRLIAFVPTKGGCGATFLATNTAYLLAKEMACDTLLIDLDLHGADASYYLSNDDHRNSLLDLTRHTERLDAHLLHSSLHSVIPHLYLLAAPNVSELTSPLTAPQLEQVLQLARQQYGMVLLDIPDALDAISVKALDLADEVVLVMGNTVAHVRNAKRWLVILRSLGYADAKLRVVLNKIHPGSEVDIALIEGALGIPVSHNLPSDPATALQAINQGLPLMSLNGNSPLVQALRQFITQAWHLSAPKRKSWLERWF